MNTINAVGMAVLVVLGVANVWLSISLTVSSWRRHQAVRKRP